MMTHFTRSFCCLALAGALVACGEKPAEKKAPEGGEKAAAGEKKAAEKPTEKKAAEKKAGEKPAGDQAAAAPTGEKAAEAAMKAAPGRIPEAKPALLAPEKLTEQAPETFTVKLETTKGDILVDVKREWAPLGTDRFFNMVKAGFYEDTGIFRVVPGFVMQFGIHGNPQVAGKWREARIQDDPKKPGVSNTQGTITFATAGPNTRTTQIFINFKDNPNLDGMGFTPFGQVKPESMKVVNAINAEYRQRPNQGLIQSQGNAYLMQAFPNLDYIKSASIQ